MNLDELRVKKYLAEIRKNSQDLRKLIAENELSPDSVPLKAAKYILIELAESISNTIQHILAKDKGLAVSGYIDTIIKAYENGLLCKELFERLKPFFDFRNSLIHRYWNIDDQILIQNLKTGHADFELFVQEIESYILGKKKDKGNQA